MDRGRGRRRRAGACGRGGVFATALRENVSEYYDRPVLKEPVWKPSIGLYLFTGGLTGAASTLAFACRLTGRDRLARRLLLLAAAGAVVNPGLLIEGLGRPERFYNMLRVVKPTSPMSIGSWLLSAWGGAASAAALSELTGFLRPLGRAAEAAAALAGLGMSTYTGALLAQTSIPAWHRARRALPFLFASGAATSAAAAAVALGPQEEAGPARRLAVLAALGELAGDRWVGRAAGDHSEAFHTGSAGRYSLAARVLTAGGAIGLAASSRSRAGSVAAALATLGGALATRLAIFEAGRTSARLT